MLAAPDFAGSIGRVKPASRPLPADANEAYFAEHIAQNYIGSYAPRGEIKSKWQFRRWLRRR